MLHDECQFHLCRTYLYFNRRVRFNELIGNSETRRKCYLGAVRALSEQSMSFPCITGPLWGSRWDPNVTFGRVLIHRWLRQNSSDYFTHIVQCRHVKKPQSWPSRILFRSTHRMESNYSRSYFSERVLFEPGKYKHHPNLQSKPFVSYGNVIGSEK